MDSKNIVIGTAGHIDHGKTTLIKALTGADTDRLKQEKERGISIELGFTDLNFDDGQTMGIIDVPGHEQFVKNMLAGAAGIDLALLVVAADEGMMPQSEEHLSILDILGVEHGIVVISKSDKVESDWLELVIEDTREKLIDTFLEAAPVISVSALNGSGIEELKSEIKKTAEDIPKKDRDADVFYPVDRVFTLKGYGTIVTGTLFRGSIKVDDKLELYPEERKLRVRSLQVHNHQVEEVYAGQRVGVNLAKIEKGELSRGDVLAEPDSLIKSKFFEGHLQMLDSVKFLIKNADRIRLHIGSQEVLGRIYFFDREELLPGEDAYVQFRLEEELVAHFKEKFVVRRYSPMQTFGGGKILKIDPPPRRKEREKVTAELQRIAEADDKERCDIFIEKHQNSAVEKRLILKRTGISGNKLDEILEELLKDNRIIRLSQGSKETYIHRENFEKLKDEISEVLNNYHEDNQLEKGMKKAELRTQLKFELEKQELDMVLEIMEAENILKLEENLAALKDFELKLSDEEEEVKNDIISIYKDNLFSPPSPESIISDYDKKKEIAEDIINYLINEGHLTYLKDDIYLYKTALDEAEIRLRNYFQENEEIQLSEFRDLIQSSRKYALPILEKMDKRGITKREEDIRHFIDR